MNFKSLCEEGKIYFGSILQQAVSGAWWDSKESQINDDKDFFKVYFLQKKTWFLSLSLFATTSFRI